MAENEKILETIIVLRNDKSTAWASSDVILREGELGVSYLDNGKVIVKAGNGADKWSSLKQVEGVLEENVTLTKDFGYYNGVPSGGKKTFENTAGMSISEFILSAFQQTVEPKISSKPELQFSLTAHTTDTGTDEIGSKIISVSYEGKVKSAGAYDVAGKSVGSGLDNGDTTWSVTYGGTTKTDRTGSFTTNVEIDSVNSSNYCATTATGTMNFADVVIPTNNLGTSRPDAKITTLKNGSTSQSFSVSRSITGFRNTWYYIGTDDTFEINAANIRSECTPMNANTTDFGDLLIPNGTKRVILAVLGDRNLTKVTDVNGMGLSVHTDFAKKTISIEGANGFAGANYSVFVFENPKGTNYPEGSTTFKEITF